jgi:hypothetical protein
VDKEAIYPVPGGWGLAGSTFFDLKKVKKAVLEDALNQAWQCLVMPKSKTGLPAGKK